MPLNAAVTFAAAGCVVPIARAMNASRSDTTDRMPLPSADSRYRECRRSTYPFGAVGPLDSRISRVHDMTVP